MEADTELIHGDWRLWKLTGAVVSAAVAQREGPDGLSAWS